MKSHKLLVSERDIIHKRYDFLHNGKFCSFESSVNDDYLSLEENVTRINVKGKVIGRTSSSPQNIMILYAYRKFLKKIKILCLEL